MSKVFNRTSGLSPGKSAFDLSYEKKFTCDMGQLIPIMCDEVVPADFFKIGNRAVIRFQPLVAPVLHEINCYVHYFFVPYRILWDEWEDFISGGVDGDYSDPIPTWTPTPYVPYDVGPPVVDYEPNGNGIGSLWDYLGFPTEVDCDGVYPIDFPRRAYNLIYNEYYRDQTLITEVALTNEDILNRAYEKDFLTSSLPWTQRGVGPALPIAGFTSAVWDSGDFVERSSGSGYSSLMANQAGTDDQFTLAPSSATNAAANAALAFNNNVVDLSTATTFDIADLRIAFQIQKWMERNARAGSRYTEFLRAHFGVSPRDDRLQRPEYIGGSKSPIFISEVLQTSESNGTAQGNLAGHGIGVSDAYAGKYKATEFGLIMGIMSILPRTQYQQGLNRQWIKDSRYDFFFPEFANLSEQAVINAEVCMLDGDGTHNAGIFGYQGRFDEMRIKQNLTCGEMRDTFNYWHLGRYFDPLTPPELNEDFITCYPEDTKRIFAVQDEPGLIVSFGNVIKAVRPLPITSEPGLVDHH